jgi:hypothetical protein
MQIPAALPDLWAGSGRRAPQLSTASGEIPGRPPDRIDELPNPRGAVAAARQQIERLSETQYRTWAMHIITVIAVVYLAQGG